MAKNRKTKHHIHRQTKKSGILNQDYAELKKEQRRTNNTFRIYQRNLVGGFVKISRRNILPGQILSFKYLPMKHEQTHGKFTRQEKTRAIPRLVLVLNPRDTLRVPSVLHGINLEYTRFLALRRFMRQIQSTDVVTLMKRRYEVRGPFTEIIDNPALFYGS